MATAGIHHVTAIAGPAAQNLDFHTRVLGLRLVKRTVNFDDPGTYHFYFGDRAGSPGSILTTFPWAHAVRGRVGPGEVEETALAIPEASFGFWLHRLIEAGVDHDAPTTAFGSRRVSFRDPDGLRLALVAGNAPAAAEPWTADGIAAENAVRGLGGVTLLVPEAAPTQRILEDVLGFAAEARDGATTRLRAPGTSYGAVVDLHAVGGFPRGVFGRGSVHHVAFRAEDDAHQTEMVEKLQRDFGIRPTEQKDRNYFRSVYFREPGGILFEIATDDPGFAVDESPDALGAALKLPGFLEPRRERIEAVLPELA